MTYKKRKKDFKQRYLKTHFYSPPRPLGGGAEPSHANSESGSGQQQAHSSFTAASHKHSGTATPLNSKAHISARGTIARKVRFRNIYFDANIPLLCTQLPKLNKVLLA
jgi:hypothetical protein